VDGKIFQSEAKGVMPLVISPTTTEALGVSWMITESVAKKAVGSQILSEI
jgi:hypothetical protein